MTKDMKPLWAVPPGDVDAWWDDLDERVQHAEEACLSQLQVEFPVVRLDLLCSGDGSCKAVAYFETDSERCEWDHQSFRMRLHEIVRSSVRAAGLPRESSETEVKIDSVEAMKSRGEDFSTPFR